MADGSADGIVCNISQPLVPRTLLAFQSLAVALCTIRFNIQKFNIQLTEYIDVFITYLWTANDYFPVQY